MKLMTRFIKLLFSCFALIGGALFIALMLFSLAMVAMRAPQKPTQHTDAIVVLTGGSNRVDEGLKLYHEGLSDYLLISGVHKDVRVGDILRLWHGPALEIGGVALDPKATTTEENAVYSLEWIKAHNVKSIRLITAYYHMPRAYVEFKKRMPELKIVPHGIQPETGPSYIKMLLAEFGKTILSFMPKSPEA